MAEPSSTTLSEQSSRFLICGSSGMIGTALLRSLAADRIEILRLVRPSSASEFSRSDTAHSKTIPWDPSAANPFPSSDRLANVDTVINLSGANVAAGRWTAKYKREIVSSRLDTTLALVRAITRLEPKPRVLVCASAIGFYGNRGDELLTEASAPGSGFLAETCIAWENAARAAEDAGIRVVHLRFGVVLSPQGGALAKLLPLFRLGLGGNLGDGREWMPWITLDDALAVFRYCIQGDSIRGPVNTVAPQPVTNAEFTRALGSALHRPAVLPAPAFALRLAFGEMADEALLASSRVVPEKLQKAAFPFRDPEIVPALRRLLSP